MDDLISRQAAIDALAKNMPSLTTPDGCGKFDHDIQVTDEAYMGTKEFRAHRVSEVFRNKTVNYTDPHDGGIGISQNDPSVPGNCKKFAIKSRQASIDEMGYVFCPHCGSKMDAQYG